MTVTSSQTSRIPTGNSPTRTAPVCHLQLPLNFDSPPQTFLTATALAERFAIQPKEMNAILAQLRWIKRPSSGKGWQLTESGKRLGARQSTHEQSRGQYALWPQSIVDSHILVKAILQLEANAPPHSRRNLHGAYPNRPGSRNMPLPQIRATDGHFVRSRAELVIDNWLYNHGIPHEYERPVPFDDVHLCDFHIDAGKGIYIEFWGYSSNPKYLSNKQQKRQAYRTHGLQLVELEHEELSDLDYVLSRRLRAFGVPTD